MEAVFARTPDMPKIIITLNEYGQPVGKNYRQLSSVIGCLVRKKLSVRCSDWRLIDAEEKDAVWDEVQVNLCQNSMLFFIDAKKNNSIKCQFIYARTVCYFYTTIIQIILQNMWYGYLLEQYVVFLCKTDFVLFHEKNRNSMIQMMLVRIGF